MDNTARQSLERLNEGLVWFSVVGDSDSTPPDAKRTGSCLQQQVGRATNGFLQTRFSLSANSTTNIHQGASPQNLATGFSWPYLHPGRNTTHLEASTPTSTNWVRPGMCSADRDPISSVEVGSTRRSKVGLPEVVSTLTGAVKWRTTCTSRND